LLLVNNLKKNFTLRDGSGQIEVLSGVSLNLHEGEILSVVGPSGCGKTTLMRILSSLEKPTSGEVNWNNDDEANFPSFFMVFQDYSRSLFPWLSVQSQLELACKAFGQTDQVMQNRINEILEATHLQDYRKFLPGELSGGMQQRVALARALAIQPKALLLDEPFGSLDAYTRYHLEDYLLLLSEKFKLTVMFVTHDIDEAIYVADRVLVLSSRPSKVKSEIKIELDRPRSQRETKASPEFRDLRLSLYDAMEKTDP
jgi:NitT/TauT family transport system ATP-binding protein